MTMRALVSADRPVVRIWHPDNPKVYVEIQFESQDAANAAVEQLNGMLSTRPGSSSEKMPRLDSGDVKTRFSLSQSGSGLAGLGTMSWRWPALLQCLLGLQCQPRPSAAHIRENACNRGFGACAIIL
jgi:hypothetical protein